MKTSHFLIVLGAAALAGYYLVKKAGSALNPTNPNNIVNQGAVSVYQAVTGDTTGTPGTGLYDALHGFITTPDGTTTEYDLANPVALATYEWAKAWGPGVPTDAAGNALPGSTP